MTVRTIDKIVAALNQLEGIEFAADAWVNEAPDNYGVVSLSEEAAQLWGDGKLTDSAWRVIVDAYVTDDDYSWPGDVQAKLEALEAEGKIDLTHTVNRDFDYVTGKVHWRWMVMVYGPLQWEEPVAGA